MQAFFKMVLTMPNIHKTAEVKEEKDDIHIFDCFSGDFGGDRDANEIADELHDSRLFSRTIVTHNIQHFSRIPKLKYVDWQD